jgi:hypothetical protein
MVEAAINLSHDQRIHGPVDITVLRHGEPAKWIRHKKNGNRSSPRAFIHFEQEIEKKKK